MRVFTAGHGRGRGRRCDQQIPGKQDFIPTGSLTKENTDISSSPSRCCWTGTEAGGAVGGHGCIVLQPYGILVGSTPHMPLGLGGLRQSGVILPTLPHFVSALVSLTPLSARLVLRRLYPLAIQICEYLRLPEVQGVSRILAHWACYKARTWDAR